MQLTIEALEKVSDCVAISFRRRSSTELSIKKVEIPDAM